LGFAAGVVVDAAELALDVEAVILVATLVAGSRIK
jgi:hypothetical protein